MNKKEISAIKRHTSSERSTSSAIHGCYVTPSGKIISKFTLQPGTLSENDLTMYFDILRGVFSPQIGKKSFNIFFEPGEMRNSEQHALLMDLLGCKLKTEGIRDRLYQAIIGSLQMDTHYLILLDFETMDLPAKKEGEDADEVFSYFVCAICPVAPAKDELSYVTNSREFHISSVGWAAAKPLAGFMFPAFSNRSKDIYSALFYAKKMDSNMTPLITGLFGKKDAPATQERLQESFAQVLHDSLGSDCDMDLIDNIRGQLIDMKQISAVEAEEEGRSAQLLLDQDTLSNCLKNCGATKEQISDFKAQYDAAFGQNVKLHPDAVLETDKYRIDTEYCTVKVLPDHTSKVSIQNVNGVRYIMIRADEGVVQLNGIPVVSSDL